MKTVESARELARTMVEIGRRMKRGMTAVITDMNQRWGGRPATQWNWRRRSSHCRAGAA